MLNQKKDFENQMNQMKLFIQQMMNMLQNSIGYNGNEIENQEAKHKALQEKVKTLQGQSSTTSATTNNENENK